MLPWLSVLFVCRASQLRRLMEDNQVVLWVNPGPTQALCTKEQLPNTNQRKKVKGLKIDDEWGEHVHGQPYFNEYVSPNSHF